MMNSWFVPEFINLENCLPNYELFQYERHARNPTVKSLISGYEKHILVVNLESKSETELDFFL